MRRIVKTLLLPRSEHAGRTRPGGSTEALCKDMTASGACFQQLIALAKPSRLKKFAWRPAPGVRSTSEVVMHMRSRISIC